MKSSLIKALAVAGISVGAGLVSGNTLAALFNPFTVTEGSLLGISPANSFSADKITGNYVEVIDFNPTNATSGTFAASIKWNAGQFVTNQGQTPVTTSYLNGFNTPNGYGLYALLQANGTYNISGTKTNFTFTSGLGLQAWLDPGQDTTLTQPATGSSFWTVTPGTSDIEIATGQTLSGAGLLDPSLSTCGTNGINCGSFGSTTSFLLTSDGKQYFTGPSPFYNISFQSGQLNNFAVSGQQVINGSLDVVFKTVPEPASLALVGLGLLGMGVSLRRRKQS